MHPLDLNDQWVARIEEFSPRRLLWRKNYRVLIPQPAKNEHLYLRSSRSDGNYELRQILTQESLIGDFGLQGIYVSRLYRPLNLVFSECKKDNQKRLYDLFLRGKWSVEKSRKFIESKMLDLVVLNNMLSNEMILSFMAKLVSEGIRDELENYTLVDLVDRNSHPTEWWERYLNIKLAEFGIRIQIDEKEWKSAEVETAKVEAARFRDFQRIEESRKRERDEELKEITARSEYERQKQQIEAAFIHDEKEREHQLQLIEKTHLEESIRADQAIENARREAERAAIEHEIALAQLRNDARRLEFIKTGEAKAEDRYQKVMEKFDELTSSLSTLAGLPENILAKIASRDQEKAYRTFERLISPEYGIPIITLMGLGFRLDKQNMIQILREREVEDHLVRIRKKDLISRDIGNKKINSLPINASLQFEFSSGISGFVTMLNFGTSGTVYLHVPNPFIPSSRAKIEADRSYFVPGPQMLPWERIGEYVEVGPLGWEHIAVIVSKNPLITETDLIGTSDDEPFSIIDNEDIVKLLIDLENQGSKNWSAAVVSFWVE